MGSAEEFEEFYLATRRRLVLQAFALTGDLTAARSAVRDAFVAAQQHWGGVARLQDPQDWVRPRAWAIAQRRHVARVWHRQQGLDDAQRATLDALAKLGDVQRKTLLLTHLAAMSLPAIGREIGLPQRRAEEHLQAATARFAVAADCDSTSIRARLEALAPIAETAGLPRASAVRRSGRRRRRIHSVVGALVVVAAVLGTGVVVHGHQPPSPSARAAADEHPHAPPMTRGRMLAPAALGGLVHGGRWQTVATTDNTAGDGINTLCQQARFADPRGVGAVVRTFRETTPRPARRRLVQTVEVSGPQAQARSAYATTVRWYAGCLTPGVRLAQAYRVTGVGDQASALRFDVGVAATRSYLVAVARTGGLTVSVALDSRTAPATAARTLVGTLAGAVAQVCGTQHGGSCADTPRVRRTLPPPSGDVAGMLAVVDLPAVGHIGKPWVGTRPVAATSDPAATTCDRTDFTAAGATSVSSRTFLIPQASLPRRFGLTEAYATLPNPVAARRLLTRIERTMATCAKRDLGASVGHAFSTAASLRGSAYAGWRVDTQINKDEQKVGYWMGVARVGRYVAQVNFAPTAGADVDQAAFTALVVRARDRLFELPR